MDSTNYYEYNYNIDDFEFTQDVLNDLLGNKNLHAIPKVFHNWNFYRLNEFLASRDLVEMGVWKDYYDLKISQYCNESNVVPLYNLTDWEIQAIQSFIENSSTNKIEHVISVIKTSNIDDVKSFIFNTFDYPDDEQDFVDATFDDLQFKIRILSHLEEFFENIVDQKSVNELKSSLKDQFDQVNWDLIKLPNDDSLALLFRHLIEDQIVITSTNERAQHVGYFWDEDNALYVHCSNIELEELVTTILKDELNDMVKSLLDELTKSKTDKKKEILEDSVKILKKLLLYIGKSSGRSNILRVIKPKLYVPTFEKRINNYEFLVATNDKFVIDLRTLEKIPRTRKHLFSKTLPVKLLDLNNNTDNNNFDINPEGDAVFHGMFADILIYFFQISFLKDKNDKPKYKEIQELIDFHQQLGGVALTNSGVKHFFLLHGDGNNSKSVYMHLLNKILGNFFTTGDASMFISQDGNSNFRTPGSAGPHILSLYQTKICCMPEVGANWKINEQFLKAVTGLVDIFKARPLYSNDYQEFIPTCKIFMPCNNPPDLSNATEAALNRALYIPFKAIFGNENSRFDDFDFKIDNNFIDNLLNNQLDLIFTWFCIGAKKFYDNKKKLDIPEIVKHKTDKFINQEDPIHDFLDDCCEPQEGGQIKAKQLYNEYVEWFKHKKGLNVKPLSITQFGTKLKLNANKYNIIKQKTNGYNVYIGYIIKNKTSRILV